MTKIVLHPNNIPMRPQLGSFAIIYLLLQNFGAPTWAYMVAVAFGIFALAGWYYDSVHRVEVDLFAEAKAKEKSGE